MKTIEKAIDAALEELPDDSLIKPFLLANRAEVKLMCITEYGEDRTFAEQREEVILTLADAAKRANMTVSEFEAKTGLKA